MIVLDFTDSEIKTLVVRKKKVELATTIPLEPGWVKDGTITEPDAISQRLREFLSSYSITETETMSTLSGQHTIYRMVNIPRVPPKLLENAAAIELEKNMPVSLEELYTTWQAIDISQEEIALCMVGTRRELVDTMIRILRAAGLRPVVFEPRPLAVARLSEDPTSIVIDAQPSSFDIIIVLGGIPVLVRTVLFSSDDLYGRSAGVKEELERTISFYNAAHKEAPITPQSRIPIILNGELPGLAEATGYQCKPPLAPFTYPPIDLTKFAACAGLALRVLQPKISPMRLTVNAIPEVYLPKPRPIGQIAFWLFTLLAVIAFLWLASLTIAEVRKTAELNSQVEVLQTRVNVRRGTEQVLKALQTKLDAAQTRLNVFQKPLDVAKAQRTSVIADIREVTTAITSGTLKLKTITLTDKAAAGTDVAPQIEMQIEGIATAQSTILDYTRRLRDSGRFSQVTIKEMKEVKYNEWQFTLLLVE